MKRDFLFTSESVTEGHPDKLCDAISDAVVDEFLQRDPLSRIIAESAVSQGVIFLAARFASSARVDLAEAARGVVRAAGYEGSDFNARDCTVLTSISETESPPVLGRDPRELDEDELDALVARNQATVFGFACRQTPTLMPLPIWLAHRLAARLSEVRRSGELDFLCPDGTTQVGIEYRAGRAARVHSVTVVASQDVSGRPGLAALREAIHERVIAPVFAQEELRPDSASRIFVNPEGPLLGGGPASHSGMTGRKTAVDSYGGYARHSEAALSGKDPLRIDRVGAYAARHAAKNVVAAGLAEECEVQLSYTIGLAHPVSVQVETLGSGVIADEAIAERLKRHIDFRPGGIVRAFDLLRLPRLRQEGFFRRLAAYGQMGREDLDTPWEALDRADALAGKQ